MYRKKGEYSCVASLDNVIKVTNHLNIAAINVVDGELNSAIWIQALVF